MGNMFAGGKKIQHTVLFRFPELARGSDDEKALDEAAAWDAVATEERPGSEAWKEESWPPGARDAGDHAHGARTLRKGNTRGAG